MFQSDFDIIADYFAKRWKGYTTIENHKPLAQIADEIEEEENMIQPIYQVVKDNPEATTEEIYQMINK